MTVRLFKPIWLTQIIAIGSSPDENANATCPNDQWNWILRTLKASLNKPTNKRNYKGYLLELIMMITCLSFSFFEPQKIRSRFQKFAKTAIQMWQLWHFTLTWNIQRRISLRSQASLSVLPLEEKKRIIAMEDVEFDYRQLHRTKQLGKRFQLISKRPSISIQ